MERITDSIGVLTLGILSWQDFRSREIAWWLLPILAVVIFLGACAKISTREIGIDFSFNLIFLCMQFLLVWLWFSIKAQKPARLIDTQIGLGDILFMICIAPGFSPVNFILFCTAGMIVTLLITIVVHALHMAVRNEIPLAGALAVPLMVLCAWRMVDPAVDFHNDEWLSWFFPGIQ